MQKLDYLKLVLTQSTLCNELQWIIKAFAVSINAVTDDSWKAKAVRFDLVKTLSGCSYIDLVNEELTLVKLDDYVQNAPLFTFQDPVTIDASWGGNIPSKVQTKIGNLIINAIAIAPAFHNKVEFISGQVTVSNLEALIAKRLKDPDDKNIGPNDITVSEMVDFVDRLYYITNFSLITNISATAKNITVSPDFRAGKAELLKKYEGQLTDPVKLVEFEKELVKLDDAYLQGDPTVGKVLTGKTKNVARKKMFLDFGYERGFTSSAKINPILNSLEEGWSLDKEQYSSYMNALRSGSYSRGKETELGGVMYKRLQRSLSGLTIADTDCGTTRGLKMTIDESNYTTLVYREVRVGSKWLHIDDSDQAKGYIGKDIVLRSVMYCAHDKQGFCYHCLSSLLKDAPQGISVLASEMSSIVLNLFMSLMHGYSLSTTTIQEKDLFA